MQYPDYFRTVALFAQHGTGSHAQSMVQQFITHPSLPVMIAGSLIVAVLLTILGNLLGGLFGGRS